MENTPTFYDHFAANMNALGLPAPKSLFESASTAVASTVALAKTVDVYGPRVTVKEVLRTMPRLFSAKAVLELGAISAAVTAAFYVGACLGSLAVATGKTASVQHMIATAMHFRIRVAPWLMPNLTIVESRSWRR